jgi:hypothetical protein
MADSSGLIYLYARMMKLIIAAMTLALGASGFADEPGWTYEKRAELRQAVVEATVTKIEKVRDQPADKVVLMKAVLEVTDVQKGKELIGDSKSIEILYETSPFGARNRCPTFAVLSLKQKGRFYLRFDEGLSKEKAFVLEMGRDVERLPLESKVVLPQLIEALGKNATYDDLLKILGEPEVDLGGGMHDVFFRLDQGPSIRVRAFPNTKKIFSVDHGENSLYRAKAGQGGAGKSLPSTGR